MPPKAKAKAGAKAKAKAAARPETAIQRTIREAVAAGHEPTLTRNRESLYIQKAGGGRLILERAGKLLASGEAYYRHRNQRPVFRTAGGIEFDQAQQWDRSGRNSFIKDRQGKNLLVTRWDAVRQEGRHTRIGRQWLERSEMNLAVVVPILLHVKAIGREADWRNPGQRPSTPRRKSGL